MFNYKISDFKVGKIVDHHPISQKYERIQYWRTLKKYCIEGKWADGVWMPPELYYYINFHNIKFEDDGGVVTSIGLPWLRDIEWEIFYIFTEACGFSGFELDTTNTCHRWYGPEKEVALRYGWITEEDIKKKKYIPARDYLRRKHKQNLGKALYENSAKNVMLMGSRGFGKDLKADTVVHRLDGPIPIKDINVGDFVYGADGKLTKVVQKTDYYDQMQYKVTFGDGRSIECGGGHLWNVLKVGEKEYKTLELNDIKDCYKGALRPNGKRDNKYFIPMAEPVEYEEKELPLDPYYLGMWLGDGNSHNPGITTINEETKEFVYRFADSYGLNVVINHNANKRCPTYNLSVERGSGSNPITSELRKLNVLNNKHIPDLYKYSSIEQRLELVKGLMDSDGHASGKHIEVTFVNEKLTDDLKDILYSLGCKVRKTVKVVNGKNYYRLLVITRIPLFKLSRKLVHWETESPSKYQETYRDSKTNKMPIVDITPTGVAHSVCIGVDNKDSLFLAGDYIVTHNSYVLSALILHNFLFDGARDYDKYLDKDISNNASESVVGSIDTKYSNDLLNKVKTAYEYLPGSTSISNVFGDIETYPSPLTVEITGSLAPNKFWQNSRKSLLHHRTFADNPLAANGTRPNRVFLDEVGFQSNILEAWGAIESTQAAAQHKRLVIFATGTGGLTSAGAAMYTKEIFYNPEDYNCLVFEDIWENKGNIGAFMPATMALNKFKKGENFVTDIAAAERFCMDERKRAEKSSNKIRYLTEVINRPIKPSEIFLRMEGNFFPIDKLKKALAELESNKRLLDASWKVDLELLADNLVVTKPSNRKVIREFPTRKGTDLDACIEIFEKPKLDVNNRPTRGRYLLFNDPVDDDGNDNHRRSLQSTFVIDSWTNRIVAEYTARTYLASTYYENVRLLCIYYNGKLLYENNKKGLYGHFKNKRSLYMLEETPDILKDLQLIKSVGTGNRALGVSMSNDAFKLFAIDLLKEWLIEKVPLGDSDETTEVLYTIRSVGLLQELIAYSMDINADRVSAMLVGMIYMANRKRHIEVAKLSGKSNINEVSGDKFWSKAYGTVNKNINKVYIQDNKRKFSLKRQ